MTRRLRIKCPACQAVLEVAGSAEPQVEVHCPKCGKRIVANIAAPAPPKPANRPASTPANRPVSNPASRPASAPAMRNSPAGPQEDLWSTPLGVPTAPLGPFPALPQAPFPAAAQGGAYTWPVRRKTNHKVWMWPVGIVLCLLVAIPIVWYGSGLVSSLLDSDWSSLSLIPDTHERLVGDYLADMEDMMLASLAVDPSDQDFRSKVTAHMKSRQPFHQQILLRAVKLPKGSLAEKEAFKEKSKALTEKYRERLIEHAKAHLAAFQNAQDGGAENGGVKDDGTVFNSAALGYVMLGTWDLPAPENDVERVYYDEADLVREFLKTLAQINSKRQAAKANLAIEQQADQMLELAIRRAKLPRSFIERVPREYVDIENAFSLAQIALVRRLERDYVLPEELQDAIDNFAWARARISQVQEGTPESEIRNAFADVRETRAKTVGRTGDEIGRKPEREMVVKPSAPAEPVEESRATSIPSPAAGQTAQTQPAPAAQPAKPAPTQPEPNAVAGGELAPDSNDLRNARPPIGFPRMPLPRRPPAGPDRGDPRFGRAPQGQPTQPPAWSQFPGPRSLESQIEEFSGPESIIIRIANSKADMEAVVKRLTEKLSVKNYFRHSANDQTVIGLKFSGPVDEVVSLIDFGTVTSIDNGKRVIHIDGKGN